jgi:hypothetical protein
MKPTGDERIWTEKYEEALRAIDSGDNYTARKLLVSIRLSADDAETKKKAEDALKRISVDPWFYVLWGISAAVIVFIFLYYIVLR